MKVLITGSSGFLGRATSELVEKSCGYEVIGLGRNNLTRENYIYSDLGEENLSSLKNKIPKGLDAIIHLAAHIDFSKNFNGRLFRINTIATSLLADVASSRNIRFVFASTSIIAGAKNRHINSNSKAHPDTNYALSKWLAEEYLIVKIKHPLILRFAGIFGSDGPSHLTLNRSIARALAKKEIPRVTGRGKAKRNHIYVKDAAKAIKYGLENGIEGTHLIAGSEVLSIGEMTKKICQLYVPCSLPLYVPGSETNSQIIEPSSYFPETLGFEKALKDIQRDYAKNSNFE